MKLISCYIAGFGRIREYNFTFEPGWNAILEENGWGKSTFATFLKAMFFGMESSAKKNTLIERSKYSPWEGGEYGGVLVFSLGERRYQLERHFGKTIKSDRFALIDLDTNLPSEDFSEKIGEELFHVDRDSFEKSVFLPQGGLDTRMTDGMNTRINQGGAFRREDVTHFEEAIARVESQIKEYKSRGSVNPGKLRLLQKEISQKKELADRIEASQEAIDKQEELLAERRREEESLEEKKRILTEQISEQAGREQALGAFRQKQNQLAQRRAELDSYQQFFAQGLPSEDTIAEVTEAEHQLAVREKELAELEEKVPREDYVKDLSALFAEEIPSVGQFESWEAEAQEIKELRLKQSYAVMPEEERQTLSELRKYFAAKNPSREELSLISEELNHLAIHSGQVGELERQTEELRRERVRREREVGREFNLGAALIVLAISLVMLLGGAIFTGLYAGEGGILRLIFGAGFFLSGLLVGLGALFGYRRNRRRQEMQLTKMAQELAASEEELKEAIKRRDTSRRICIDFLSAFPSGEGSMQEQLTSIRIHKENLDRLMSEEEKSISSEADAVEQLSRVQMELYTQLQGYADAYDMDLFHDYNEEPLLERLKEDAQAYRDYLSEKGQLESLREQVGGWKSAIDAFLAQYPVTEERRHERVNEIRRNLDLYWDLTRRIEEITKELRLEESAMDSVSEGRSVEELQVEQAKLDSRRSELGQLLHMDRSQLSNMLEELEDYEEAKEELDGLMEREADMKERLQILELTKAYLNRARESYLARYIGPLRQNMQNYLHLLGGKTAQMSPEDITIDINLEPKVLHKQSQYRWEHMSAGYYDLVSLCARFALMDTIFEKEKPMIILDDPLTNLDEDKVARALDFLQTVARDHQIIYFSCHPSRMPQIVKGD